MPTVDQDEMDQMLEMADQRWIEQRAWDVRQYGFVASDEDQFKKNYENYVKELFKSNASSSKQ